MKDSVLTMVSGAQPAGWTDERVETLKKLWMEGLSASQIAGELGEGVTRNAVIGKVHRLGLSGRAAPSQPQRTVFKAPRPARPAVVAPPVRRPEQPSAPQAPIYLREETPGSATVLTLGAHMCKWPIGDPSTDGFSFCGRRTGAGQDGPYCNEHSRVAYQPSAQRKSATGGGKRNDATELARSLRRYI